MSSAKKFGIVSAAQTVDVHLLTSIEMIGVREDYIANVVLINRCVFCVHSSASGGIFVDSLRSVETPAVVVLIHKAVLACEGAGFVITPDIAMAGPSEQFISLSLRAVFYNEYSVLLLYFLWRISYLHLLVEDRLSMMIRILLLLVGMLWRAVLIAVISA